MSLYRCAACGSSSVTTEKKVVKKGLFSGLFGGKSAKEDNITEMFKCLDCGNISEKPMSDEIKVLIDLGVDNLKARENLILNGEKIDWEKLKNNYKNIESGRADEELFEIEKKKIEEEQRKAAEYEAQLISEYKSKGAINDEVAQILAKMKINGASDEKIALTMDDLNSKVAAVEEAKRKAAEQRADLIAHMMANGMNKEEAEKKLAELSEQIAKRANAMARFRKSVESNEHLSSLGYLNESELSFIAKLLSEGIPDSTIANVMNGIRDVYEKFLSLSTDSEVIIYRARRSDNYPNDGYEITTMNDIIYEEVLKILAVGGLYSLNDLKTASEILSEIPDDSIQHCLKNLRWANKIVETSDKNNTYWSSMDWEV